ncbi:MAG: response regulator [Magnetococcales bacterium]|nr:response regulator [Magnetococcales bacterium]
MKTALIIEDDDNNMELVTFILEASGYATLRAETGLDGVAMARNNQPDFIILDIQLPDIQGTEVLQRIRQEESDQGKKPIPVIAMTSLAMSGDRERLLTSGCTGYIEKPIDPEKVVSQIQKIIGD